MKYTSNDYLQHSFFFLVRVDPFSEGDRCAGMHKGSHKKWSLLKMAENVPGVSIHPKGNHLV